MSTCAEPTTATGSPPDRDGFVTYARITPWYSEVMDEARDQLVTLRLTADELDQIDQQAAREGRDRSSLIRWALRQYMEQRKAK